MIDPTRYPRLSRIDTPADLRRLEASELRAVADELRRPLLVFEPLRCDYRWASDRLHRFVLDGMAANRAACRRAPP